MIYLDNAATSFPKPPAVAEALVAALGSFGNPSRSAHEAALTAGRCVEGLRAKIAGFFGCPWPERVVFTKNVTEALNLAISSLQGHIVTTEAEHNSVLRPVHRHGNYTVVPVDGRGVYTAESIARACRPDTAAVVVAQASNLTGNLAPLEDIACLCRERGLYLIVDAAQTAGFMEFNLEKTGVDAYCFTGHKSLYGPQGTGGLVLSQRFTPEPLMVGGSGSRSFEPTQPDQLPDRLEAGTLNGHGLAGLSAGLDYVRNMGPAELLARADRLARLFYGELKERVGERSSPASAGPLEPHRGLGGAEPRRDPGGVTFYGDYQAGLRMPIVTLNVEGATSEEVAAYLAEEHDIAVRAGAHCAPLLHRRFGTEKRGAVRFSFSHFNTEPEVRAAVEALERLVR